jgi:hypothetical protein
MGRRARDVPGIANGVLSVSMAIVPVTRTT